MGHRKSREIAWEIEKHETSHGKSKGYMFSLPKTASPAADSF
ncbi:MAG: hypothetical protein ABI760_13110 [Ferruginibacter sp.]